MVLKFPVVNWAAFGVNIDAKLLNAVNSLIESYECAEENNNINTYPIYVCTRLANSLTLDDECVEKAIADAMIRWFGFTETHNKIMFDFLQEFRGITLGFYLYDQIRRGNADIETFVEKHKKHLVNGYGFVGLEDAVRNLLNIPTLYPQINNDSALNLLVQYTGYDNFDKFRHAWVRDMKARIENELHS